MSIKTIANLPNILPFRAHFHYLFANLDPVQVSDDGFSKIKKKSRLPFRLNVHYLFPLLLMSYFEGDSLYVLASHHFQYNATGMYELYTHKYFPDALWHQGSAMAHWGIFVELFTYGMLVVDSFLEDRFVMYINKHSVHASIKIRQNGKFINREVAEKILTFRRKAKLLFKVLIKMEVLQVMSYFGSQVYAHWRNTVKDYIFAILLPCYAFYAVYGAINLIYYFLLSLKYLSIKQRYQMDRIHHISQTAKIQKQRNGVHYQGSIWLQFTEVNGAIRGLLAEFEGYNSFWSYYITCCFISYTGMICYLSYGLLSTPLDNAFMMSFFVFFLTEFIIILLVLCCVCSKMVKNNVNIYKENVNFCYTYRRHFKPKLREQLMMDKMIANFDGARIGFRLQNNLLIDQQMFEFLVFYISTIFFKIVKRSYQA